MKTETIWNIILQTWDRYGKEVHFSLISFRNQIDAVRKFNEWKDDDEEKPGFERCDDHTWEYFYEQEDGGFSRVVILESELFASNGCADEIIMKSSYL